MSMCIAMQRMCICVNIDVLFSTLNVDLAKVLLQRGAQAKIIDRSGLSVLHTAGACGASPALLLTLYKAGIDPTLRSNVGRTAAEVSLQYGHPKTSKLLEKLVAKHLRKTATPTATPSAVPVRDAAPRRRPVKEGEFKNAPVAMAAVMRDADGNISVRFLDDYRKEEQAKLKKAAADKLKKVQHVESVGPQEPCLNCDALTDRLCSRCGASYFCSRKCEVAASFVCCG